MTAADGKPTRNALEVRPLAFGEVLSESSIASSGDTYLGLSSEEYGVELGVTFDPDELDAFAIQLRVIAHEARRRRRRGE